MATTDGVRDQYSEWGTFRCKEASIDGRESVLCLAGLAGALPKRAGAVGLIGHDQAESAVVEGGEGEDDTISRGVVVLEFEWFLGGELDRCPSLHGGWRGFWGGAWLNLAEGGCKLRSFGGGGSCLG